MFECECTFIITVPFFFLLHQSTGFSPWSFALAQPQIALLLGLVVVCMVAAQVATVRAPRQVLRHADGRRYGK